MTTLLIFGGGRNQLPVIRAARERGLRVVVMDNSADVPGAELADTFHALDLGDIDSCLVIARAEGVDGALTVAADYPVPTIAAICEALGLPGLTSEAALRSTDKYLMYQSLRDHHVPAPVRYRVWCPEDAVTAARRLKGDVIVKPARSSGGRGVVLVGEEASNAELARAIAYALVYSPDEGVVMEPFVSGPEVSVETLTYHGETTVVAITDKYTVGPPHFVEVGHSLPCAQSQSTREEIERVACAAIAALGINDSPGHVEIRVGPSGPRVIELGGRLGGGCITSHLVPLATGVDMLSAAIDLALGLPPKVQPDRKRGAAVRFLQPDPGTVAHMPDLTAVLDRQGVIDVQLWSEVGDSIAPLQDARQRVGYVIAESATAGEAIRIAETARDSVVISVTAGGA